MPTKKDEYRNINGDTVKLLPQPSEGTPIQYYPGNNRGVRMAAIVTHNETPGRITLVFFEPLRESRRQQGVWHVSSPEHARKTQVAVRNGSWDYLPGTLVSPDDFEAHREVWKKSDENKKLASERQEKINRDYQENQKRIQEEQPQGV